MLKEVEDKGQILSMTFCYLKQQIIPGIKVKYLFRTRGSGDVLRSCALQAQQADLPLMCSAPRAALGPELLIKVCFLVDSVPVFFFNQLLSNKLKIMMFFYSYMPPYFKLDVINSLFYLACLKTCG